MLLKDYLEKEAHFISPEPQSEQKSTSSVSDVEVLKLQPEWNPTAAYYDPLLVDSLIEILEEVAGTIELPPDMTGYFANMRRVQRKAWVKNQTEPQSSHMVHDMLDASVPIFDEIGLSVEIFDEKKAEDFKSKVDYYLLSGREGQKVVIECKSPGVFRIAEGNLFGKKVPFSLNLSANRPPTARKVVNKLCLYMGAHQAEWGALTCHDKWLFVRLHKSTGKDEAYITYSTVEEQRKENTSIFRALLGMVLANEGAVVESHANLSMQLENIEEEEEERPSPPSPPSDGQSGSEYDPANDAKPTEKGSRDQPPVRRPRPAQPPRGQGHQLSTQLDILLGWSPNVTSADKWLQLFSVPEAGEFPSLGDKPVRMWLQREIGWGSTGHVYEACLDVDGQKSISYAIKTVKKGTSEQAKGRVKRLQEEVDVYRVLEKARASGQQIKVAPRCYGLYETSVTFFLILDYVGESLPESGLEDLGRFDKMSLFEAIKDLHAIGISHRDLAPRNIMRGSDGSLKLIDFTHSTLHRCPGHWANTATQRRDPVCKELRTMYKRLVQPEPSPLNIAVM